MHLLKFVKLTYTKHYNFFTDIELFISVQNYLKFFQANEYFGLLKTDNSVNQINDFIHYYILTCKIKYSLNVTI